MARAAVRARPEDAGAWAQLGTAEVEQARTTLDAGQLSVAGEAFARSLALRPARNYDAVAGEGMLANARHEFGAARDAGRRATAMAPDRGTGWAVLADAYIQLGDYPAATAAAQRLLDLAPATAAYTRAAYDLETHGRAAEAAIALRRGLDAAGTPADAAFCEHRLGELAWEAGDVAGARQHYRRALAAAPGDYYAQAGLARTDAARGRTAEALASYANVVRRVPVPQFLLEYAELALKAGRKEVARSPLAALAGEVRLLQASGGPVDPYLALYQADHADPGTAVTLLRAEWGRRNPNGTSIELIPTYIRVMPTPGYAAGVRVNGQEKISEIMVATTTPAEVLANGRPTFTGFKLDRVPFHGTAELTAAIEKYSGRPGPKAGELFGTLTPHFDYVPTS